MYKKISLLIALSLLLPVFSFAAVVIVESEVRSAGIGQSFTVQVVIDSEQTAINAMQGTVTFPTDILEVVDVDRTGSVFNFWVEEPTVSNDAGAISFIGGTAKGVSGEALHVFTVTFKTNGSGAAELSLIDAAVTASDGKGTNVLSTVEGASIGVGTEVVIPEAEFDPEQIVVAAPVEVTRTALAASELPKAPVVSVPLYPDPESWYKHIGDITVSWDVPPDVLKVAVEVDQLQNTEPSKAEEKLFNGKEIGSLSQGVWYVHVQYKNNVGWGEVAHYRIAIDRTPPLPFEVELDNSVSDNPSPEFIVDAQDALSGVSHYLVSINGGASHRFASSTIQLPPSKPGEYTAVVRVVDKAGNSTEDDFSFEVLPLPTPTITFVTKSVPQDEFVFISGEAVPNGFVIINLVNRDGVGAFVGETETDNAGNWSFAVEETLALGTYTLTVSTRDERGAISFASEPEALRIRAKTVLSLGFVDLGWFEIFLIVVLFVFGFGGYILWQLTERQKTKSAYNIIAQRDVVKLTTLLSAELKELESWHAKQKYPSKHVKTEVEYRYKKLGQSIEKMKKYLSEEISKTS